MAKTYPTITDELRDFIHAQPMFFVATAPLDADGHVNLSPKGLDCFRVLSPNHVAYLDLTGSGNETSAHLHENGRITFMFCAFSGPPKILRLYGQGTTCLPASEAWAKLQPLFPSYPGARQIISAEIHRVQTSCGFAVPLMEYAGQRDTLIRWAEAKGDEEVQAYQQQKNARSLDEMLTPIGLGGVLANDS